MSAQKNSSDSDSVERRPDLLWARSQRLLSWLSYPWARFFCQLSAPHFLLLSCGGSMVPASHQSLSSLFYMCCYGHYHFSYLSSLVGLEEEPHWGRGAVCSQMEQLQLLQSDVLAHQGPHSGVPLKFNGLFLMELGKTGKT